ncbi:APO protein 3, mitochondrial [Momordica charantia]|uniref:APO protein 3, mitochondrial n=1 Tax=Momordica charantia TaxID=3673 RepID=A0A6J1CBK2_MOMCH|nr:APO protein 3, mitochondrial [Momordica charantia]XP_022137878.1 APO protein 3, mitochondrial [Momordica charantia]XP_022137879.1 APO protein 3, mitochondrial [Momordica charantia]XP_022137880.1 APO protein 3, mitochondrial [Momordica charantia]XP_022137882.1 APO protein 3, mitochondrial [Momordica charantia]
MRRRSLFLLVRQICDLRSGCSHQNLCRHISSHNSSTFTQTAQKLEHDAHDPLYVDIPKPRTRKSERKPYPTPMNLLILRAKEERKARKAQPCRMVEHPPDNGLLLPDLVHVAQAVYLAWKSLLFGMSRLVEVIPVQRCRSCFEVHIGHEGHEIRTCSGANSGFRSATHNWRKGGVQDVVFFPKCYHLYDRVGKPRVGHDERHGVPRIPAILELCIQAGVDLEKYPSKRRTKPVYSIEGRIVDFELVKEKNEVETGHFDFTNSDNFGKSDCGIDLEETSTRSFSWNITDQPNEEEAELRKLSIKTLDWWLEMVSGAKKIMEKYRVQTCGYCPEVQVGPRGHKVRMCRGSKHQSRNGLHAWQEATIDDLVGANHVWHVRDLEGPPLDNKLKRFYGQVPAVVELCVQAGAPIPDQYRSMMRLDVVPPDRDEVDLVA